MAWRKCREYYIKENGSQETALGTTINRKYQACDCAQTNTVRAVGKKIYEKLKYVSGDSKMTRTGNNHVMRNTFECTLNAQKYRYGRFSALFGVLRSRCHIRDAVSGSAPTTKSGKFWGK